MAIAIRVQGSDVWQSATQTIEVPKPAGLVDDDVLVFPVYGSDDQALTSPESGIIKQAQSQGNTGIDHAIALFTKHVVDAAAEPVSYTFDIAGGVDKQMGSRCIAYSGVDTITPMDAAPVLTQDQSGTIVDTASIITVTDGAWVFSTFGAVAAGLGTPASVPVGYTDSGDEILVTNHYVGFVHKLVATAGAENPGAWGAFGASVAWSGMTFALRPLVAGGGGGLPVFRRRDR